MCFAEHIGIVAGVVAKLVGVIRKHGIIRAEEGGQSILYGLEHMRVAIFGICFRGINRVYDSKWNLLLEDAHQLTVLIEHVRIHRIQQPFQERAHHSSDSVEVYRGPKDGSISLQALTQKRTQAVANVAQPVCTGILDLACKATLTSDVLIVVKMRISHSAPAS